jgi:hypothetical protein
MRATTISVLVLALSTAAPLLAQHGWPLEPTAGEHPIGNSFGEFQDFGGVYQHTGLDILSIPMMNADGTENAAAPWVRATVAGSIDSYSNSPATAYNGATVDGDDGSTYRYWHLEYDSYDPTFVTNFNNGDPVAANDRIAKVVRWSCDYHHCHYDLYDATNYINPFADITPNPDPNAPLIQSIALVQNNVMPWSTFSPVSSGGCIVVSGNVDVIGQIRDRDDAGSALTGATTAFTRNLRWRACPDATPGCAWVDTRDYATLPLAIGGGGNAFSTAAFSNLAPYDSSSDYCATTWNYGIVTNFAAGTANTAGRWDTTAVADGAYTVSIEATDFAGNTTVRNVHACVQNGAGCVTELMIRDASDDPGGIPYAGPVWWQSPDITANPGTSFQDANIRVGDANPIDVTVRNSGSCDIAAGTVYTVCLGWGPPSGSITHPLPAAQVIGCQTVTVGAGGMAVGGSRVTTFTWTPSAATTPLGHHCLVAWVDHPLADPVQNTPAVNWDDNRAQQNIEFVDPPGPGAPGAADFWVNPQEMIRDRSLEIVFEAAPQLRGKLEISLLLPPELGVERIIGGGLTVARPEDVRGVKTDVRLCDDSCTTPEEARKKYCLLAVRGIDVGGRVVLHGIEARKPERLLLVVRGSTDGRELVAHVIEHGTLAQPKVSGPVGGVTIRFAKVPQE